MFKMKEKIKLNLDEKVKEIEQELKENGRSIIDTGVLNPYDIVPLLKKALGKDSYKMEINEDKINGGGQIYVYKNDAYR